MIDLEQHGFFVEVEGYSSLSCSGYCLDHDRRRLNVTYRSTDLRENPNHIVYRSTPPIPSINLCFEKTIWQFLNIRSFFGKGFELDCFFENEVTINYFYEEMRRIWTPKN